MTHKLKTWPPYFEAVLYDRKRFEVRKANRNFEVGDWLVLEEWSPEAQQYTGRSVTMKVDYILRGGQFGVEDGYVVMSISVSG